MCEGRVSPHHVLPACTISESGGMMSGGVEGCNMSSLWTVMRHTHISAWMVEAN